MTYNFAPASRDITTTIEMGTKLYAPACGYGVVTKVYEGATVRDMTGQHTSNMHALVIYEQGAGEVRESFVGLVGNGHEIFSEKASLADIAAAIDGAAATAKADKERREAAAVAFAAEVESVKTAPEYADLLPVPEGERYGAKHPAKNVRVLLKKHFPGVKFSVRVQDYDVINIKWTDGPTVAELEAQTNQFIAGKFDGMQDYYEYKKTPFTEAFGGAKYIFTTREFSDTAINKAINLVTEKWGNDEAVTCEAYRNGDLMRRTCQNAGDDWQRLIRDQLRCVSMMDAQPAAAPMTGAGAAIEEHTHTKRGFQMFLVIPAERLDLDPFRALADEAKNRGGWYSKKWGNTPGGFAFKDQASAAAFLADYFQAPLADAKPAEVKPTPRPAPKANGAKMAEKFRKMAEGLQAQIDNKLAPRLTNTPKRMHQAANARLDGEHLQRTQAALLALADLHEANQVPAELQGLRTKADIHSLMTSAKDRSNCGYYDAALCLGKPATDSEEARAAWALLSPKGEAQEKAETVRRKIEALQFANIPGYFPTPPAVVRRMLDVAGIGEGMRVLEPEAGSGAIADLVREEAADLTIDVCERHASLREILELKGYELAGSDFLTYQPGPIYDRVMMNPPFENQQDIDHVRAAFDCLRSGGCLVAIMAPSAFFRSNRKSEDFRTWLEELNGYKIDLPEGSFKESGTGVSTVLVVIDKP